MGIYFGKALGIDMGTAYTRVCCGGMVMCEPTIVAAEENGNTMVAAGAEAAELLRCAPGRYRQVLPVCSGYIRHREAVTYMLRYMLAKILPCVGKVTGATICIPYGLNERQYDAWEYCAMLAGIRKVHFIEEPLAAGLSQGWDVYAPYARMSVSLGAGSIRAAAAGYAGVIAQASAYAGGNALDEAIARYIARAYGVRVGGGWAERLKVALGAQQGRSYIQVSGQLPTDGRMADVQVCPAEFGGVLQLYYQSVLEVIRSLFYKISPDAVSDIAEEGILLYGGNALLYGLRQYLQERLELPVTVSAQPLYTGAVGAYRAIGADKKQKAQRKAAGRK